MHIVFNHCCRLKSELCGVEIFLGGNGNSIEKVDGN